MQIGKEEIKLLFKDNMIIHVETSEIINKKFLPLSDYITQG